MSIFADETPASIRLQIAAQLVEVAAFITEDVAEQARLAAATEATEALRSAHRHVRKLADHVNQYLTKETTQQT